MMLVAFRNITLILILLSIGTAYAKDWHVEILELALNPTLVDTSEKKQLTENIMNKLRPIFREFDGIKTGKDWFDGGYLYAHKVSPAFTEFQAKGNEDFSNIMQRFYLVTALLCFGDEALSILPENMKVVIVAWEKNRS